MGGGVYSCGACVRGMVDARVGGEAGVTVRSMPADATPCVCYVCARVIVEKKSF